MEGYIPVKRCQEGGVSLVSSSYANELIDTLNALGLLTIAPIANVATAKIGPTGAILDFSKLDGRLRALEALLFVNNTASVQDQLDTINNYTLYLNGRMNNANASANGSCSGNNIAINISLNI